MLMIIDGLLTKAYDITARMVLIGNSVLVRLLAQSQMVTQMMRPFTPSAWWPENFASWCPLWWSPGAKYGWHKPQCRRLLIESTSSSSGAWQIVQPRGREDFQTLEIVKLSLSGVGWPQREHTTLWLFQEVWCARSSGCTPVDASIPAMVAHSSHQGDLGLSPGGNKIHLANFPGAGPVYPKLEVHFRVWGWRYPGSRNET